MTSFTRISTVLVLAKVFIRISPLLERTSLLPDKNMNRLLVINLSAVRIETVALKEMCW